MVLFVKRAPRHLTLSLFLYVGPVSTTDMSIFQLGGDETKKLDRASAVAEETSPNEQASGTIASSKKLEERKATKSSQSGPIEDGLDGKEAQQQADLGFSWPEVEESAEDVRTIEDPILEMEDPIA